MDENLKKLKLGDTFDNGSLFEVNHKVTTETTKQNKITSRILQYDTKAKMLRNTREIKSLRFEAENMVTGGVSYDPIIRDMETTVDLVAGTYTYLRIEVKELLNPL